MAWSLTNLLIQIVGGILGGHAAAAAAKEHSFGALGHTLTGLAGGAFSGGFFQIAAATMVTGTGSLQEPSFVEQVVIQCFAGAVAGGIVTLAVGFMKHSINERKLPKG